MSRYVARTLGRKLDPEWDALLRRHRMASALIPHWDELSGWTNIKVGAFEDGRLVGGLLLAVRRIPFFVAALSRITCMMLDETSAVEMADELLDEVERIARRSLLLETELRLRVPTTGNVDGFSFHRDLRDLFTRRGYEQLGRCETTYFLEVDRSDDELMASFKPEYRNRIRKMRKKGAHIDQSWKLEDLDDFAQGFSEMTERKSITAVPSEQVGRSLAPLLEAGHCEMFTERYGEKAANIVIIDALGVPTYALGTRSRNHVRGDVPGAAQLVHFEVMRTLRERGHKYYDLGGCQGPAPIETDANYGTWRFKYGFRPKFVRFIPYHRKIRAGLQGALNLLHRLRGDYL